MQQPQLILSFSHKLYRRLLKAYPTRHRQRFSNEMTQVFGDLCRDIYMERGLIVLLGLWLRTLIDILKTALEERLKEATNMTKEKFIQLSGWALMLGGITFMLGFAASGGERLRFIIIATRLLAACGQ